MNDLADKSYWNGIYHQRHDMHALETEGFRNYFTKSVLQKLCSVGLEHKRVLEMGAGDSAWLTHLAKHFPSSSFYGLDYSPQGCGLLAERTRRERAQVEIICEDFFSERSPWHGTFDVVYSFGVVEHFASLSRTLSAIGKYLRPDGVLVTFIPNLSGILGTLSRQWNKAVYDKHVPHDWLSFRNGHSEANLRIESGGYLGSSNFGTISSCFVERSGPSWHAYVWLTRVSKVIWFFESMVCDLPATKKFSPYIYAVSRLKE